MQYFLSVHWKVIGSLWQYHLRKVGFVENFLVLLLVMYILFISADSLLNITMFLRLCVWHQSFKLKKKKIIYYTFTNYQYLILLLQQCKQWLIGVLEVSTLILSDILTNAVRFHCLVCAAALEILHFKRWMTSSLI